MRPKANSSIFMSSFLLSFLLVSLTIIINHFPFFFTSQNPHLYLWLLAFYLIFDESLSHSYSYCKYLSCYVIIHAVWKHYSLLLVFSLYIGHNSPFCYLYFTRAIILVDIIHFSHALTSLCWPLVIKYQGLL